MADSIIACSTCLHTSVAQEKNIPNIIFDPLLPPMDKGYKKRLNKKEDVLNAVKEIISLKRKKTELGDILVQLAMTHDEDKNS